MKENNEWVLETKAKLVLVLRQQQMHGVCFVGYHNFHTEERQTYTKTETRIQTCF